MLSPIFFEIDKTTIINLETGVVYKRESSRLISISGLAKPVVVGDTMVDSPAELLWEHLLKLCQIHLDSLGPKWVLQTYPFTVTDDRVVENRPKRAGKVSDWVRSRFNLDIEEEGTE